MNLKAYVKGNLTSFWLMQMNKKHFGRTWMKESKQIKIISEKRNVNK